MERGLFSIKLFTLSMNQTVAKLSLSLVKLKIMLNVLLVNQMTLSSIKINTLFINGEAYEEDYLTEALRHETDAFGPVEVPEGKYFVMGDNRPISKDSRNGLGLIDEDDIIGRSEFIIFPFDHISMTR